MINILLKTHFAIMYSEYKVKWDVWNLSEGCCIISTKCFEDINLAIEKVRQLRNDPTAQRVHVIEHIYYQGENLEAELINKAAKK